MNLRNAFRPVAAMVICGLIVCIPILGYLKLFYWGTEWITQDSPDGNYTMKVDTTFRIPTFAMPGGASDHRRGWYRLYRKSDGRKMKELYVPAMLDGNIRWGKNTVTVFGYGDMVSWKLE